MWAGGREERCARQVQREAGQGKAEKGEAARVWEGSAERRNPGVKSRLPDDLMMTRQITATFPETRHH